MIVPGANTPSAQMPCVGSVSTSNAPSRYTSPSPTIAPVGMTRPTPVSATELFDEIWSVWAALTVAAGTSLTFAMAGVFDIAETGRAFIGPLRAVTAVLDATKPGPVSGALTPNG